MMEKFRLEGTLKNMGGDNDTIIIIKFHANNMVMAAHKADNMARTHAIVNYKLTQGW